MPDLQKTKSERLNCGASKCDANEVYTSDLYEDEV